MGFADTYLNKHNFIKIAEAPSGLLRYIVCVPAYCEHEIFYTLESLKNCRPPKHHAEVFVLINYPEDCPDDLKNENLEIYKKVILWSKTEQTGWLRFHVLLAADLPRKHAGAGLARKILMDSSIARFNQLGCDDGLILSLDSDTIVTKNYFSSLEQSQETHPSANCFIFNFAHDTAGSKFPKEVYEAATLYELYLRYYKQMLESTGFPFSYYTIGSCFAIPAEIYIKAGGMNKHKAGEDFYFLQKIFPFGNIIFLKDVVVKPDIRPSWRVPFGTGPAIQKIIATDKVKYKTYHPDLFRYINRLTNTISKFYDAGEQATKELINQLHPSLRQFLTENNVGGKLLEIKQNTSSIESFIKRFYGWFNGFLLIKYLNFASRNYLPEIDVCEAVKELTGITENKTALELLEYLRKRDME